MYSAKPKLMLCVAYGVEGDEFHYIMCNYLKQDSNIAVIMSIPSNLINAFLQVMLLH